MDQVLYDDECWQKLAKRTSEEDFLCFCPARRHMVFVLFVRACIRPSVCASGTTVSMISCRVFDTFSPNLCQRCTVGQRWTCHILGVERWKVKVMVETATLASTTPLLGGVPYEMRIWEVLAGSERMDRLGTAGEWKSEGRLANPGLLGEWG